MKRRMKQILAEMLTVILVVCMLAGCGDRNISEPEQESTVNEQEKAQEDTSAEASSPDAASGEISLAVTYTNDDLEKFKAIINDFEQESGISVDLISFADGYEDMIKTMMASNTLPDVWMTHGWSLKRYSEYLQPVNDQPWFDNMTKALEPVMADEEGNVYALCVTISVSGPYFNADALKKAGIDDPFSIVTWEDFENVCDKVKEAGMIPIAVGGGSGSGQFSTIFNGIAHSLWTDEGAKYDLREELKNGTFDSDVYVTEMYEMIAKWIDRGYFNEDYLTLDFDGASQLFGNGEAAFMLRGPLTVAHEMFPEANLGVFPEPASADTMKPAFNLSESDAYGVWKDTENPDACWALLSYLARTDVAQKICQLGTKFPALDGVDAADAYGYQIYANAVEAYGDNLQFDSMFDQTYCPSGMYSIMGESLNVLFADPSNIPAAVAVFKDGYEERIAAANQQ